MSPRDLGSESSSHSAASTAFDRNQYWGVAFGLVLLALAVGWILLRVFGTLTTPDLSRVHQYALLFVGLCLGIGGLTTALVQIIRILVPFRGAFHRKRLLKRWQSAAADWNKLLGSVPTDNAASAPAVSTEAAAVVTPPISPATQAPPAPSGPSPSRRAKLLHLVKLLSGKQVDAEVALTEFEQRGELRKRPARSAAWLYDLPIEQLAGQLSLAIDAALDEPSRYANLLLCSLGPCAQDLLLEALRPLPKLNRELPDKHTRKLEKIAAARGSLSRLSQFEVDAFQIETSGPWRRGLRLWVVGVSTLISLVLMSASLYAGSSGSQVRLPRAIGVGRFLSVPLYGVLEGLVAGYLAMLLRDIIAIIEAQRRRT